MSDLTMPDMTGRRLRVRVDHDRCVGSTICVQVAPNAFTLNENKQSIVLNAEDEEATTVQEAAEECPLSAIILEDADTGERVFP